jgi:hypothetical protein
VPQQTRQIPVAFSVRPINRASEEGRNLVPQDGIDVNDGSLPVILHAAMRQDIELSSPEERNRIIAKVTALKTRSDAACWPAGQRNGTQRRPRKRRYAETCSLSSYRTRTSSPTRVLRRPGRGNA